MSNKEKRCKTCNRIIEGKSFFGLCPSCRDKCVQGLAATPVVVYIAPKAVKGVKNIVNAARKIIKL